MLSINRHACIYHYLLLADLNLAVSKKKAKVPKCPVNLLDCLRSIHHHLLSNLSKLHDMDALIIIIRFGTNTDNHPNFTLSIKEILKQMSQF